MTEVRRSRDGAAMDEIYSDTASPHSQPLAPALMEDGKNIYRPATQSNPTTLSP